MNELIYEPIRLYEIGLYYYPPFVGEETEACRCKISSPRSSANKQRSREVDGPPCCLPPRFFNPIPPFFPSCFRHLVTTNSYTTIKVLISNLPFSDHLLLSSDISSLLLLAQQIPTIDILCPHSDFPPIDLTSFSAQNFHDLEL